MTGVISIGVLSDTHGLLRPAVGEALAGSELLVHAGDVGEPAILDRLASLAPVTAVRGNVDHGAWAERLPPTAVVERGGAALYVLHDLATLDLDPAAAGFHAVVFGHSHRPTIEHRGGVLYLNPGSCGPQRFHLPITVARLTVRPAASLGAAPHLSAEIVELACPPERSSRR